MLPQDATNVVTNVQRNMTETRRESDARLKHSSSLSRKQEKTAEHKEEGDENGNASSGFVDDKAQKSATDGDSYVSTRYPQSPKLYTSLMKLVMKCLSVEAVADPLKPLFYGDAANGFCLSKVFSIPDLHARGAERKYAFLVVCDSETHLLRQWHFVSSYVSEMISYLQGKVETVREKAKKESLDNERYLRRLKNMPRSLVELAGDPEVFVRLHLCGIELLRDVQ